MPGRKRLTARANYHRSSQPARPPRTPRLLSRRRRAHPHRVQRPSILIQPPHLPIHFSFRRFSLSSDSTSHCLVSLSCHPLCSPPFGFPPPAPASESLLDRTEADSTPPRTALRRATISRSTQPPRLSSTQSTIILPHELTGASSIAPGMTLPPLAVVVL